MPHYTSFDIVGTHNDELIRGKHGNDTLDGAGGSDVVNGEKGDDLLIFNLSENIGEENLYDGGKDYDTFRIVLTLDQFHALRAELSEMKAWIAENADVKNSTSMTGKDEAVNSPQHPEFETSFGLTIRNFEDVEFYVDGIGEVDPDNNAPELEDDNFSTDEDNSIVITTADLLANDSDIDGDTLTVVAVSSDAVDAGNNVVGTVTLVGNDITFSPNLNFSGTAFFNYTVSDGNVIDDQTATVSIEVNAVADAPIVTIVDTSGDEDTAIDLNLDVQLADTDGSESLSDVTISGVPANASLSAGTLQLNGDWVIAPIDLAGLQLIPAPDFFGEIDLEVSVDSVEASNNDSANTTVSVTVTVNPVNDAPVATDDAGCTTDEDVALVIDTADIHANDFDIDGDTLTVTSVSIDAVDSLNNVVGSVALSGSNITFTPNANYSGDAFFDYTVDDGNGGTDTATVSVNVVAVADAPIVAASAIFGDEDTAIDLDLGIALADTDGSESLGDVTISGVPADASLSAGTLQLNGDWVIAPIDLAGLQLIPAPDFFGEIDLEVSVDSVEASNNDSANTTTSITVNVAPANDAPDANDDAASTIQTLPVIIDVADLLANDTDIDGDTLNITSVQNALNGTAVLAANTITFTPDSNFVGDATFEYTVDDGNGGTDVAVVTVTVQPGVPVTVADIFNIGSSAAENIPADGVLANDTDPLGGVLNATVSSEGISTQTIYTWNNGIENITLEDTTSDVSVNSDGSVDVNTSFYNGYYNFTYEANNAILSQTEDFQLQISVDANGKIDTGTDEVDEVVNGSDSGEAIVANGANDFIVGNGGNDVIVGDSIGGDNSFDFPDNLNLALSLDFSGSMNNAAIANMISAATTILNDYIDAFENNPFFQSVSFNVHVNGFSNVLVGQQTFNDVNAGNLGSVIAYMNTLSGGSTTNYGAALDDVEAYFVNNAVAGDINDFYFFSDGVPLGGVITTTSTAADYVSNFPDLYGAALDVDIISVGIDNGNLQTNQLDLLDDLTANNSVIDINTLFTDTGFELPFTDGSDNIDGGSDNDIIFGDSIATEGLSAQLISDLNTDTKATIEANHSTLNVEGQTRGGNDIINGGDGDDIIYGQAGDDVIDGGNGNDTIFGGVGSDTLTGGLGADTFVFFNSDFADSFSTDTITDFENGIDLIDISDYGILDFNAEVSIVDTIDGALISVAGTSQDIVLQGVLAADLDNSDFVL